MSLPPLPKGHSWKVIGKRKRYCETCFQRIFVPRFGKEWELSGYDMYEFPSPQDKIMGCEEKIQYELDRDRMDEALD